MVIRVLWSLLNLALVCCVIGLGAGLRHSSAEIERLRAKLASTPERQSLSSNSAGSINRRADPESRRVIGQLRDEIARLKSLLDQGETEVTDDNEPDAALTALLSRPLIQDIPLLSEAEYHELLERRARMPQYLSDKALRSGDIDSLLQNQEWNPDGRELSPEERLELSVMLKDYEFYTHLSKRERLEQDILPLVDAMRERGEYIEYTVDEGPPVIEGVRVTHAEPADDPSMRRLYIFREETHPEIHHAHTVERDRALEIFVRAYEMINSGGL